VAANRWAGKDLFTFAVQDGGMKLISMVTLVFLGGCGWSDNLIATAAIGGTVASLATIQRTPADAIYSWWNGRDCSVVRLDQGKSYCRPVEPKPDPPAFCTRSLGAVNCWKDPENLPGAPSGVADGPAELTAEQEANRTRKWPW
jgi:hypothetical protein